MCENGKIELERVKIEIEQKKLNIEQERLELERNSIGKYIVKIISLSISIIAVIVSASQVWIARIEKSKELEILSIENRRRWELDIAEYVASYHELIFSKDESTRKRFNDLLNETFPPRLVFCIFNSFGEDANDKNVNIWRQGALNSAAKVFVKQIKIKTKTRKDSSSISDPKTDDFVFISFAGREYRLNNPNRNDFEMGQTDTFIFDFEENVLSLGEILQSKISIRIGPGKNNMIDDWDLEELIIEYRTPNNDFFQPLLKEAVGPLGDSGNYPLTEHWLLGKQ